MNPTQKEIYEKTVKRLAHMGVKDPTGQIVALAEEIERYRSKIEHLQAYIQGLPKPQKGRYTQYDPGLERFVVPCLYKLNGEQITFSFKDARGDVPSVWGEVIDALAYYENQEAAKEAERCVYKKKMEEIQSRPDCNDCDASATNTCGMCPLLCAAVRINCPYHKPKRETDT